MSNLPNTTESREVDVLIVGAGISGINAAYRVQEQNPDLTYLVVDRRRQLGGTWDLFRYPGIRSDSDFFTLAFPFHPWTGKNVIVDGNEILAYLTEVTETFGIDKHLQFDTKVHSGDWSSADARWTVKCTVQGAETTITAKFVIMCTGYYDYDNPYDPEFQGVGDFTGEIVHPQFWPEDLACSGKRITVIGSGATAVTLVPSLAKLGADVTMVQRTPSYVLAQPRHDPIADTARRFLPAGTAHCLMRAKNTALQWTLYQACRRAPGLMKALLRKGAIAGTGSQAVVDEHFTPPYNPWDQRLCIAPHGDLFTAVKNGSATMVTGSIDTFVPEGLRLTDGRTVEADIVVTATGLSIKLLGGIEIRVDGTIIDLSRETAFRGVMLSNIPNLGFCIGYINLSWTMRADMSARLLARILRRLSRTRADWVAPALPDYLGPQGPLLDMQSGYLARAAALMPRATNRYPWAMAQNFFRDAWATNRADLDEGLRWANRAAAGTATTPTTDSAITRG
ncbi:flavin-containing monooxygenase [Rhodococcus artemisiae]|uniref:NAD(P)/FAD-dependent oxidoreductase n=1 Tax=Rhodococcus artemisiae TaxID=714159 RepID=A0ABU7LAE3_9NOCA|nr:NAD(P)/FAD-dependent oxidoreductase [Rhodococcus artemisiae]MEE2058524.1 NAD(P)/FAD-dependent oxidoreductase [Rhodococcus artemisiae]